MAKIKTTQKQFEYFGKRVKRWQEFWKLANWRIDVSVGDSGDNYAHVYINHTGRCADVILNKANDIVVSNYQLDKTAFHEVCEVLLTVIIKYAEIGIASDIVHEVSHDLIRRLENVVFEANKDGN
jgi:hypothetical protein